MKKIKKIFKWGLLLLIGYFVITTLYFGYDDIDSEKGVFKFYWSGLRGLSKDSQFGFGFKKNEIVETKFNGVDGPYVLGDSCFFVDSNNVFHRQKVRPDSMIEVQTSCANLPKFMVRLKDSIKLEKDLYEMPEKLIAISDIEGNFNALYSFLYANKVIDSSGGWIYGNGHLVLNGDFMDRGKQVSQVLWLIYSLENEALLAGGKVHFIIGNHEVMNLYGDVSYNDFKYMTVAKKVSGQNDWDKGLMYLYSDQSELGRWLRSKNIVEKIGSAIFVHGGLNTYHMEGKYSIKELNAIARKYYGRVLTEQSVEADRDRQVLNSINSPYWDRRLNFDWQYKIFYKLNGISASATTQKQLETILKFYEASTIIIGHSVVSDIQSDYNNKVIKIDVKHGNKVSSGKTKGLFMEHNSFYKTDDFGNKAIILKG